MATPTVTTTALPVENGAIPAANAAPEAPFDALLALIAPVSPASDGADGAIAAVLPNGEGASLSGAPVETVTAVAAANLPDTAAVQTSLSPLLSAMVNGPDQADTDLAALLAASAIAGRGVTARAPVQPDMAAAQPKIGAVDPVAPVIPAEDFIGPVRPLAAGTAEFDGASGADEDFIGPVLPPERVVATAQLADVPLSSPDRETRPAADATPTVPEAAMIAASALPVQERLPEAEALLQPEVEVSEAEQTNPPAMAIHDLAPADAPVLPVALLPAAASAASADAVAGLQILEKPDGGVRLQNSTIKPASSALVQKTDVVAVQSAGSRDDSIIANIPFVSVRGMPETSADAPDDENVDADPVLTVADGAPATTFTTDRMAADGAILVAMQNGLTQAPRDKTRDAPDVSPRDVQPRFVAQPQGQPMALRDEAVLRIMNSGAAMRPVDLSPAKNDARNMLKTPRTSLSEAGPVVTVASDKPALNFETDDILPQRLRAPVDLLDRVTSPHRDPEHTEETSPPHHPIDPRAAAMVRSIVVTGSPDVAPDQAQFLSPTSALPPSASLIAENAGREAPLVSAVAADSRRDAQRDADIRERQIKQQVTMALRAGNQEVRMQLYPPGLGQVMIRIALDGQKLRLSMQADNSEASDALLQAETGLRDALSRDGFSLAGFDVHDEGQNGRKRREATQTNALISNPNGGEGEAFSVDMTA